MRYVGAISGEGIPGYAESNLHISRAIRSGLRLNLTLDNLMHRRQAEWDFGESLVPSRAVRAALQWTF